MSSTYRVCRTSELPEGSSRITEANGVSIGVFHIPEGFFALLNRCPHRGAPLCRGVVTGLVTAERPQEWNLEREGEIVRCPWHGWEFDIATGKSVFNPHRVRTRSYPVTTEPDADEPDSCPANQDADLPGIYAEGVDSYATTVEDDWVVVHLDRVIKQPVAAEANRA